VTHHDQSACIYQKKKLEPASNPCMNIPLTILLATGYPQMLYVVFWFQYPLRFICLLLIGVAVAKEMRAAVLPDTVSQDFVS